MSRWARYAPLTGWRCCDGQSVKPSWCFVVSTTYRAPAAWHTPASWSRSASIEPASNSVMKSSYGASPYTSWWCCWVGLPGICIELRYHSAYGLERSIPAGPSSRSSCWMFATCGAQPGTEYRPQCRNTPSLASSYQAGTVCVETDSQVGSNEALAGPVDESDAVVVVVSAGLVVMGDPSAGRRPR